MKPLFKLVFAFILIYYGYGVFENVMAVDEPCTEYDCETSERVVCPEGYAIYLPKEDAFLPCKDFDQYANIGNKSVLVRGDTK